VRCSNESLTTVGVGVGFMYIKTSKNWPQKYPAGQPDVDSNQVAISSEKNSLFYRKVCWVTFQTEHQLNQHSVLYSGEKQFVYKLCGKQFQQVYCFDVHYQAHICAKPCACKVCGKEFSKQCFLKLHKFSIL
jgi:hypothetical protein